MKISICNGKKQRNIWLPLALLKSKLAVYFLKMGLQNNAQQSKERIAVGENGCCVDLNEAVCPSNDNDGLIADDLQKTTNATELLQREEVCAQNKKQFVPNKDFLKEVYVVIRKAVRKNGHFRLVEVQSSDGESITVTV